MNKKKILRKFLLSGRTLSIGTFIAILSTILLVIFLNHNSFFNKIELISLIIWGTFFSFLFIGFHRGIKVKKDTFKFKWTFIEIDIYQDIDFGDDILTGIGTVIIWLIISFIASFLISLIISISWALLLISLVLFSWLYVRMLRIIFIKTKFTKGNIPKA